jgi:hypothetical protein
MNTHKLNFDTHTTNMKKAEPVETPKDKPKAKKATKSKYEDLPEIPDYERPELEKYEQSDFDPSKKVNFSDTTKNFLML